MSQIVMINKLYLDLSRLLAVHVERTIELYVDNEQYVYCCVFIDVVYPVKKLEDRHQLDLSVLDSCRKIYGAICKCLYAYSYVY